jgi:hypothetical protein
MPTKIGPNKGILYREIFIQIVSLGVVLFGPFLVLKIYGHPSSFRVIGMCAAFGAMLWLIVKRIPVVYGAPYWVSVDDELKVLEIKYFLRKTVTIRRADIVSYQDKRTEYNTRSGKITYSGITAYLIDGAKVVFTERCLEDYLYIESMLAYWGVKKIEGEEYDSI